MLYVFMYVVAIYVGSQFTVEQFLFLIFSWFTQVDAYPLFHLNTIISDPLPLYTKGRHAVTDQC